VEQHTGRQYDDDLTVGMDDYDDSLQTGSVDLFEFASDTESPITRLKELVLSIDWEITDDILRQFNEELLDLKDIWANDKVNLVYVQALEKISRYIYKEKADAHPNAIKLLLRFYSNLEKIVSTPTMSEDEKKTILIDDVDKFEKFKRQIKHYGIDIKPAKAVDEAPSPLPSDIRSIRETETSEDPLLNLKAIIFGMDWEITENDLIDLGEEVSSLEKRFSGSKAKLIILQGIGALGAYINLKRSNAHVDAFQLLQSFFLALETIVMNGLSGEEEKKVLMPEVNKFNVFKEIISSTITPEAIAEGGEPEVEEFAPYQGDGEEIMPAFADFPEDVHGFRAEEEVVALESEINKNVYGQIENFFAEEKAETSEPAAASPVGKEPGDEGLMDEMESRLNGLFFDDSEEPQVFQALGGDIALQGVDVETEADDDSDEEALPRIGADPAPALMDNLSEIGNEEEAISDEAIAVLSGPDELTGEEKIVAGHPEEGSAGILPGLDVETEADDDLEEEPLPLDAEELAPALFAHDDVSRFEDSADFKLDEASAGIEKRLTEFFGEDEETLEVDISAVSEDAGEPVAEEELMVGPAADLTAEEIKEEEDWIVADVAKLLQGVDVETEADDDSEEEALPLEGEELAPALSGQFEESDLHEDEELAQEEELAGIEDRLEEFFDDEVEITPALEDIPFTEEETKELEEEEEPPVVAVSELPSDQSEQEQEGDISFHAEADLTEKPAVGEEFDLSSAVTEESWDHLEECVVDEDTQAAETTIAQEFEDHLSEFFGPEETAEEEFPELSQQEEIAPEQQLFEISHENDLLEEEQYFSDVVQETQVLSPSDTRAEKDEATLSILQEDEDFIEYIEGVEFDDEEGSQKSDLIFTEDEEEVVFEAVDEEDVVESEAAMMSFADEIETEFGKYFIDQEADHQEKDQETAANLTVEEVFAEDEIFGESLEETQAATDSIFQMDEFPEPQKKREDADLTGLDESILAGIESMSEGSFAPGEGEGPETDLDTLRACIALLSREADDRTLGDFLHEISRLNSKWATKPIDKTFLQLIATVVRYINQYPYEAGFETSGLLLSVFNALEKSRLSEVRAEDIQESICAETANVLEWQQRKLISKMSEAQGAVGVGGIASGLQDIMKNHEGALDSQTLVSVIHNEFDTLRQSINDRLEELFRQHSR
jgi:pilus assembly protein FimV